MRIRDIVLPLAAIFFAGCTQSAEEPFPFDKDVIIMYYDRSDYPMQDGVINYDLDKWRDFEYIQECYIISAETGKRLSDISFRHLTPFSDGIAIATDENGLCTYVGKDGKRVISEEFKEASIFSEGIAWVITQDSEVWAINKSGKRLFKAEGASDANSFYKGLAVFHDEEDNTKVIDKKGNIVFEKEAYGGPFVVDGLIAMKGGENFETGLMDMKGNFVVEPKYYAIGSSAYDSDIYINSVKGGRYIIVHEDGEGLMDRDGKVIISPQYNYVLPDGELFLLHQAKETSDTTVDMKAFWVDRDGNPVSNVQYEQAFPFGKGKYTAVASVKDSKWGLIDKKGEWFIEPSDEFDFFETPDGNNLVVAMDKGDKCGLINLKKETVVPFIYESIINIEGTDRYIIFVDGKYGLMDSKGNVILAPEYDGYSFKFDEEGEGMKTYVAKSYFVDSEEEFEG